MYACGSNVLGQLGNGRTDQSLPVCIESLKSTKVTSISCGEMFSAAVSGACDQHSLFLQLRFRFIRAHQSARWAAARGEVWVWGSESGEFVCTEGRYGEYPRQVGFVGNVRQVACRRGSEGIALLGTRGNYLLLFVESF